MAQWKGDPLGAQFGVPSARDRKNTGELCGTGDIRRGELSACEAQD
jgi:hypothetical protein